MVGDFFKDRIGRLLVGILLGPVGGALTMLTNGILGIRGVSGAVAFFAGYAGFVILALAPSSERVSAFWLLVAYGVILMAQPYLLFLGDTSNMAYIAVFPGFFVGIILVMLGFIVKGPGKPWR